ncbi:hypothetical protein [Marivirga lumbricoides]
MIIPRVKNILWLIIIAFLSISIMLLLSPYFLSDWKVWSMAIFLTSFALTLLWGIDFSHLNIKYDNLNIFLTGYFNGRNLKLKYSEIKGFQIEEKVDQYNGLHQEIQIVMTNGKKIYLPKIAYDDYSKVEIFCHDKFKFLGIRKMKHGEFIGKLIPVMGLVSGILFLLVSIIKQFT